MGKIIEFEAPDLEHFDGLESVDDGHRRSSQMTMVMEPGHDDEEEEEEEEEHGNETAATDHEDSEVFESNTDDLSKHLFGCSTRYSRDLSKQTLSGLQLHPGKHSNHSHYDRERSN